VLSLSFKVFWRVTRLFNHLALICVWRVNHFDSNLLYLKHAFLRV
jgi:hypothetical protein